MPSRRPDFVEGGTQASRDRHEANMLAKAAADLGICLCPVRAGDDTPARCDKCAAIQEGGSDE